MPINDEGSSRAVWLFLATAFGISWASYFVMTTWQLPPAVAGCLRFLLKFGPSLAGVLAIAYTARLAGLKSLAKRLIDLQTPLGWTAIAVAGPVILALLAAVGYSLFAGPMFDLDEVSVEGASGAFAAIFLTRLFAGGGLGEELGWRGFLLPRLLRSYSPIKAALIVGIAHGLWHLPALGLMVIPFLAFTTAGSLVMTGIHLRTEGNLLLPVCMHAAANASVPVIGGYVSDQSAMLPILIGVILLWVCVALATAVWLNSASRQRQFT